ncbi:hypothetical protein HAX54_018539, partial [Datura stramonium]|nr:hypothetical protein [Datura stramonium]
ENEDLNDDLRASGEVVNSLEELGAPSAMPHYAYAYKDYPKVTLHEGIMPCWGFSSSSGLSRKVTPKPC